MASAIKSYRRISFSYHNRLTEFVVCNTQIQSTQTTVIGNPSAVVKINHSFSSSFLKESYICFDSKVTAKPVSTSILISTFLLKHKSARFRNSSYFKTICSYINSQLCNTIVCLGLAFGLHLSLF